MDVGVRVPPRAPFLTMHSSQNCHQLMTGRRRVIGPLSGPSAGLSDRESVLLRQGPQLLQREPAPAAGCWNENARPYTLRTRRLASFPSAEPTPRAFAAQRFGAFVRVCRPPVWILCTQDYRYPRLLHSVRLSIATDNMTVLYLRYSHTVDRVEYAGISHRCMNDVRAARD